MKPRYYVLNGHAVVPVDSVEEWGKMMEGDRTVAKTAVWGWRVSTVFLGLDHSFGDDEAPLVFETMIFPSDSYSDQFMLRCSTWEEAEACHAQGVEWAEEHKWRGLVSIVRNVLKWMAYSLHPRKKQGATPS